MNIIQQKYHRTVQRAILQTLRESLEIYSGLQAALFLSGRRRKKMGISPNKPDSSFLTRRKQFSLSSLKQFLEVPLLILILIAVPVKAATVMVEPGVTRSINGISELDRQKYINLSSSGNNFESIVGSRYDRYVNQLEMTFGRDLGIVNGEVKWGHSIYEDLNRPGWVDIDRMISKLSAKNGNASARFMTQFAPNLNVAAHENNQAYPDFMESYYTAEAGSDHPLPLNTTAAAELVVNLLQYGWTDFYRPSFYEPLNEPHWSYWNDSVYAALHTDILHQARQQNLSVQIGGPCLSIAYFYKNNYQHLSALTNFIDRTQGELDFYSFHVYDYMHWDGQDFSGRITSGLPLEGVLDAVANYTQNRYGKPVSLVVSEHGGYVTDSNGETIANTLANQYFPKSSFSGTDWEWEMKKRSIINFIMVNSAISNTMVFMNHPHIMKKAVPFILLETVGWDPRYYSSLLVSENFQKPVSRYWESRLVDFFEYFKDVRGRRINSIIDDADIQHQAFVDQNRVILLFHNMSMAAKPLGILVNNTATPQRILIRRLGRSADFTPYLAESEVTTLAGLQIEPLESLVVVLNYPDVVQEEALESESDYYGDKVAIDLNAGQSETFYIALPEVQQIDQVTLRISLGRPAATNHDLRVEFNGHVVSIPVESSAERFDNGSEYGTLKLAQLDPQWLAPVNSVNISFSDGHSGGIGSVLLRAAVRTVLSRPDNLLADPGFESGTISAWNDGWGSRSVSSDQVANGNYCGQFNGGAVTQIVSLQPQTTYTLSGQIKSGGGQTVYMGVKNFGNSETAVWTNQSEYQSLSLTFTTGTDPSQTQIYVWSSGLGYADELSLKLWQPPLLTRMNGPFLEADGVICFEAEHYHHLESRADSPKGWLQDNVQSGAVGDYMWTPDGQFTINNFDYSYGARMLYELRFLNPGEYQVFVRRRWDANQAYAGSNSVWAGLDGVSTGDNDNTQDNDVWIWKSLGTIRVDRPGDHLFDLVRREDGYKIDRIVLTQGEMPEGDGPAESSRALRMALPEYALLAAHWLDGNCVPANEYCQGGDMDQDGQVSVSDIVLAVQYWLSQ